MPRRKYHNRKVVSCSVRTKKSNSSTTKNPDYDNPLAYFAQKGKIADVKQCIKEGADVNKILECTRGYNVLFMVIMAEPFTNDHLKVIEVLIASGIDVSNHAWIEEKNQYTTLLHLAIVKENIAALDMLIKNGANVNYNASECFPLLHWAVEQSSLKMTRALLKHRWIRNLIDVKSSLCEDNTALHHAIKLGYHDIALMLIENGANVNTQDDQDMFVIHDIAATGPVKILKVLLEKGANVNAKGFRNVSPLKMAILHRQGEIVKVLLENGADPNMTCIGGSTALHTSVMKNEMEEDNIIGTFIFRQLMDYGAKVNVKDKQDWYPLHFASKYGKTVEVNSMLQNGALIDPMDENGYTPLAYACQEGHVSIAKALIEAGASLDTKTKRYGQTPLHFAVYSGKVDLVRLLVRSGAQVDAKDNDGSTPLKYATTKSFGHDHQNPIIDFLLCNGAKMETGGCCTECLQEMDYLKL